MLNKESFGEELRFLLFLNVGMKFTLKKGLISYQIA